MKSCKQCDEYDVCSRQNDLRRKKPRCPKAKIDKPKTNGDFIRSMSDYDLADWIANILMCHGAFARSEDFDFDRYCADCPLDKCCNDQPSDNIEDWLKSPVEVGNGT